MSVKNIYSGWGAPLYGGHLPIDIYLVHFAEESLVDHRRPRLQFVLLTLCMPEDHTSVALAGFSLHCLKECPLELYLETATEHRTERLS